MDKVKFAFLCGVFAIGKAHSRGFDLELVACGSDLVRFNTVPQIRLFLIRTHLPNNTFSLLNISAL